MLARNRMAPLDCASWESQISITAEGLLVTHHEPDFLPEEITGSLDKFLLPFEAAKKTRCDSPAALMDQEIGIASRCQTVVEGNVSSIFTLGFEYISRGDDIGFARSPGEDRFSLGFANAAPEMDLHTKRLCLLEEPILEALHRSAALNEIIEWAAR